MSEYNATCDLCREYPHINKKIKVDWDEHFCLVCQTCLDKFGEYAISCSLGSYSLARKIAKETGYLKEKK